MKKRDILFWIFALVQVLVMFFVLFLISQALYNLSIVYKIAPFQYINHFVYSLGLLVISIVGIEYLIYSRK